jgi:hypothetical protein
MDISPFMICWLMRRPLAALIAGEYNYFLFVENMPRKISMFFSQAPNEKEQYSIDRTQ